MRATTRLAALFAFCSAPLGAQELPDISTLSRDPRAVALGSAVTAAVNDLTAISSNPAGLAAVRGTEVRFGVRSVLSITGADLRGTGGNPNAKGAWVMEGLVPVVDFVGIAHEFHVGGRPLAAALAWRTFVDGGWYLEMLKFTQGVSADERIRERRFSSGGTRALSASLAARPHPRLAFGVTGNLLGGTQTLMSEDRTSAITTTTTRKDVIFSDQSGVAIDVGAQGRLIGDLILGVRVALAHTRAGTLTIQGGDTTDVEHSLPMSITVGAALPLSARSVLSVDYRIDP